MIILKVIEKASSVPDRASVEQRQEQTAEIIDETIIDTANGIDATSIIFTPQGGGRWRRLLTGDIDHS